jgi:hypothetical protein
MGVPGHRWRLGACSGWSPTEAFDEAMASVRRGEAIPLETFRAILQRL